MAVVQEEAVVGFQKIAVVVAHAKLGAVVARRPEVVIVDNHIAVLEGERIRLILVLGLMLVVAAGLLRMVGALL